MKFDWVLWILSIITNDWTLWLHLAKQYVGRLSCSIKSWLWTHWKLLKCKRDVHMLTNYSEDILGNFSKAKWQAQCFINPFPLPPLSPPPLHSLSYFKAFCCLLCVHYPKRCIPLNVGPFYSKYDKTKIKTPFSSVHLEGTLRYMLFNLQVMLWFASSLQRIKVKQGA